MNHSRRRFLMQGGTLLASQLLPGRATAADGPIMINSALAADGFPVGVPGAALLAVMSDLHINLNEAAQWRSFDDSVVSEVNGLRGLTDVVIAGDIITSHSNTAGDPRYPTAYATAHQEFDLAKAELSRFNPLAGTWIVPGNHDTDNEDVVPELWMAKLWRLPYQRTELGGVPVFFLNSGHAGMLDSAQDEWFAGEAAGISRDREILVVAHHPSLFYMVGETGLKRSLARIFAGWRATVFVIGGHGHGFHLDCFTDHGTRFVQMEVATANGKAWSDGVKPGFAVLGLNGGRVLSRIYRPAGKAWIQVLPPVESMAHKRLPWPFERVPWPGYYVEAYASRSELVSFEACDMRGHFGYVQSLSWRFPMASYQDKAREFLLLASVADSVRYTVTVSFADGDSSGPWLSVPLPGHDGGYVHRVPIPETLRGVESLKVKFSTSIPRYAAGISIGGWGIGSLAEALTGYERWCAGRYRTFVPNAASAPEAVPSGQTFSNLELFAFNLAPPEIVGMATVRLSGTPVFARKTFPAMECEFSRRTPGEASGVTYVVQSSVDQWTWVTENEESLLVTPLDDGWELVRIRRLEKPVARRFFRVGVASASPPTGGLAAWQREHGALGSICEDADANGLADGIDYALDTGDAGSGAGLLRLVSRDLELPTLTYVRMAAWARPGLRYEVERSADAVVWQAVPDGLFEDRVLMKEEEWEQVLTVILDQESAFFRIRAFMV
ncbi:MAG: metallophosphoesterase [Verrucomicrobia bacterium]|nr:metallophosphoesterase [Verrucomicrobiota bacterium]